MQLSNISAIVTGGASGIGFECVKMLWEAGAAKIGVLDIDSDKIDAAIKLLTPEAASDRLIPLKCDLTSAEQISGAFALWDSKFTQLDVLINNAGLMLEGPLLSISFRGINRFPADKWQSMIDVNLKAPFLCSQLAVERMIKKRVKGVIVNLSSHSRRGHIGQSAYSSSKAGVDGLTFTLARELKTFGIRCCAIAPGVIDTPLLSHLDDEQKSALAASIAVGRLGKPSEVAHSVRFCIENDYFNGRVLEIDGGFFE